ncbi:MAG: alpha/beta hydrolase [Cyanobacteriota bacterium]|nr:alpha/beta hydrolase [Cyanobacteriota bacterium]
MPTIEILGVKHTYELSPPTSSKPTIVFLHGWLLSRRYWQPLVDRLSPHYQCLCYDLRGFGDSQPDRERPPHSHCRYTPAAYAADLAVLLERLQIERTWLVGHSLGGTIALWGAHQLGNTVEGVVCVNAGGGIYLKEEFEKFRAAGTQIVKLRPRWLCRLPLLELLFVRASVARPIARRWARQRLVDFVTAHPQAALRSLLDSTTEAEVHQLPQIVSQLNQPVYFFAGANDSIMDPKYVRHLASFHQLFRQGGNNVIEIPECGHLAMVEQPDLLADRLRSILKNGCESSQTR